MKNTNEVKLYTTFEDQREVTIIGIRSVSIALPIDEACRWMETTFGITLCNWEVWTEERPDSDLIVHKPEAMSYVKSVKPKIKDFVPMEKEAHLQRVAENMVMVSIILLLASLIICGIIISTSPWR